VKETPSFIFPLLLKGNYNNSLEFLISLRCSNQQVLIAVSSECVSGLVLV